MKISESSPALKAMDVERHATRALWLEGMPPVRQSKSSISSDALCIFPAQSLMMVFKNCAKNQLNIQDRKTGELNKALNCPERPSNMIYILSLCNFLSSMIY